MTNATLTRDDALAAHFPGVAFTRSLTTAEVAGLLGIPLRSFEKHAADNGYGFKVGKHRRFTAAHVAEIITAGEKPKARVTETPTQRRTSARSRL